MSEYTQKEVCNFIGMSARQVRRLQSSGDLIKAGISGKIDGPKFIQSLVDYKIKMTIKDDRGHEQNQIDLEDEKKQKARLTKLQADKEELIVAKMKNELIPICDVSFVWTKLLSNFKSKCLALISKIGPRVVHLDELSEVQEILEQEIHQVLIELSEFEENDYIT
ncbi:MAG: hypothetical protein KC646_10200 [Candidatus Cloacimonetes bacterium]|nr:hypothetical protein [Candidatus Cloacimonadota bacterium]